MSDNILRDLLLKVFMGEDYLKQNSNDPQQQELNDVATNRTGARQGTRSKRLFGEETIRSTAEDTRGPAYMMNLGNEDENIINRYLGANDIVLGDKIPMEILSPYARSRGIEKDYEYMRKRKYGR